MDNAVVADPFDRIARIVAAHRICMERLGHLESARIFRGVGYTSLCIVRIVAESKWPSPVGYVADRLNIHQTHASRLLSALEGQGFLASERGFDRRRRDYRATDLGTALAEDFRSEIAGNACRTILYWPPRKQVEVVTLLERLVKVLNAP